MPDTNSLTGPIHGPFATGTQLLGGIAWINDTDIFTAGLDGKLYHINYSTTVVSTLESFPVPHLSRVRVLRRDRARQQLLIARSDGTATRLSATLPLTQSLQKIGQQLTAQRFVQSLDAVGTLIGVGLDRKVYLSKDKNTPSVSSSAVPAGGDIKSVSIAVASSRTVVLTQDGSSNNHIYALDSLSGTWTDFFPSTIVKEGRPESLAISDNGNAVAIVAKSLTADFNLLWSDGSASGAKPIPIPTDMSANGQVYVAARYVGFWPGETNAWIILLTDSSSKKSLRKLTWDSNANQTSTIVIADVDKDLSAAPIAFADGGGGTIIVSAWSGGLLRIDRLTNTSVIQSISSSTLTGLGITAVALVLKPEFQVAALTTDTNPAKIWQVVKGPPDKSLFELSGILLDGKPYTGFPVLGWRGTNLIVGTKDSASPLQLQLESVPNTRQFPLPTGAPTDVTRAITAVAWVSGDDPIFGLANTELAIPDTSTPGTYKIIGSPAVSQMVRAMARQPTDGSFAFALTLDDNKLHVRRVDTPEGDISINVKTTVTALDFNANGTLVASGTASGGIEIRSISAGVVPSDATALTTFSTHEVQGVAFFGENADLRLAAIDRRGAIQVWKIDMSASHPSFSSIFTASLFPDDTDRQASLDWSPDGKKVAIAVQDGSVFIIDLPA